MIPGTPPVLKSILAYERADKRLAEAREYLEDAKDFKIEITKEKAKLKELDYDGTQEAADKAYILWQGGHSRRLTDSLPFEFGVSGEFVAIGYYGSAPLTNKYCTYYFSSEYEYSHDIWQYLVYVHIEGVKYQFRFFEDGSVSLGGQGEFDGWYGRR